MKGSIRTVVGLLITFGAVGGIDAGENLLVSTGLAIVGLLIMASGVRALNEPRKLFSR